MPDPPTQVIFTLEAGQVWIDPDGTSWYLKWIDGDTAHMERTVVEQRPIRDLVRISHLPNDAALPFRETSAACPVCGRVMKPGSLCYGAPGQPEHEAALCSPRTEATTTEDR
jgi:hypothetical protein